LKTPKTDHNLLIEKCIQGDERALMEIYNRYYKAMYNTSIRIVKNNYEAEDIMQEAFITAFKKLDKLENSENFGAWLKRIVVNKSIEVYKKNISKNETEIDYKLYKLESFDCCNDKALETKTKYENVLSAMSELKDNYGTLLNLNLIEGYDYDEICEIMSISYSNCRTMMSRAKDSLRKKLSEMEIVLQ
jgi:RNA polymerase sigma-70 factor (ECF subfamily)